MARALVDRGVFLEPRSGAACTHAQGLAAHGIAAPRSLALVLRGLSPTPVPPAARALGCGTCPHAGECGREGYAPYERVIDAAPGQRIRIAGITLQEQ